MKTTTVLMTTLSLLVLSAQPIFARCGSLIREGREVLWTTKVAKADQDNAKGLLDEAQKNLDACDHTNGVKNATAALDILKKK